MSQMLGDDADDDVSDNGSDAGPCVVGALDGGHAPSASPRAHPAAKRRRRGGSQVLLDKTGPDEMIFIVAQTDHAWRNAFLKRGRQHRAAIEALVASSPVCQELGGADEMLHAPMDLDYIIGVAVTKRWDFISETELRAMTVGSPIGTAMVDALLASVTKREVLGYNFYPILALAHLETPLHIPEVCRRDSVLDSPASGRAVVAALRTQALKIASPRSAPVHPLPAMSYDDLVTHWQTSEYPSLLQPPNTYPVGWRCWKPIAYMMVEFECEADFTAILTRRCWSLPCTLRRSDPPQAMMQHYFETLAGDAAVCPNDEDDKVSLTATATPNC